MAIDRDGNKHCSWCGVSTDDIRPRSEFCSTPCADAYRRDEIKQRRNALAGAEPFDWPAIRDMVRAPAYFETVAKSNVVMAGTDRGLDVSERARKAQEARQRNGGGML